MKIGSRVVGDVTIFDVEGVYWKEDRPDPSLKDLVKARIAAGARKILFDLEKADIACGIGGLRKAVSGLSAEIRDRFDTQACRALISPVRE